MTQIIESKHITKEQEKSRLLDIPFDRTCKCAGNRINCLTPKEWLKGQIGVWQFFYEKRDIRDKEIHPATFPISLSSNAPTKVIGLP